MIVRNGGEKVNTCAILRSSNLYSFGTIHKSSGVGSWLSGCDSKV